MERVSHTPGPWHISQTGRDFNICFTPQGNWLATVHDDGEPVPGRTEADARLIAAAPTMLAALKDIYAQIERHDIRSLNVLPLVDAIYHAEGR